MPGTMFRNSSRKPSRLKYEALRHHDASLDSNLEDDLRYLLDHQRRKQSSRTLRRAMEWCCIPTPWTNDHRSKNVSLVDDEDVTDPSDSSSNEKIDLLSDEGATMQEELWVLTLKEKLRDAKTAAEPFFHELATHATFDSSLQFLTTHYSQNGFSKRMSQITPILNAIQPFATAISTMVQAHPEIAALVWGSVQLILQVDSSRSAGLVFTYIKNRGS